MIPSLVTFRSYVRDDPARRKKCASNLMFYRNLLLRSGRVSPGETTLRQCALPGEPDGKAELSHSRRARPGALAGVALRWRLSATPQPSLDFRPAPHSDAGRIF